MKLIRRILLQLQLFVGFLIAATPTSAELSAEVRQNHVLFTNGGSELDTVAIAQIRHLGQILNTPQLQGTCLKLLGYSDQSGGVLVNQEISLRRAEMVAQKLSIWLSNPNRIQVVEGYGAVDFLNEISIFDPHQRRVAIYLRDCSTSP